MKPNNKITYNKLVRDNIPTIINSDNKRCTTRILNDKEYKEELDKKLEEEIKEYEESKDLLELADIQEIIDSIIKVSGITVEEFKQLQAKKRNKNGGFDKKILLIDVEKNK